MTLSLAVTGPQATGGSGTDTVSGVERISGSHFADELTLSDAGGYLTGQEGDDTLTGGAGIDSIGGGDGADVLYGKAGGDSLNGGPGDDRLVPGTGDDFITGDTGYDRLSYGDAPAGVTVSLAITGASQNTGGAGSDWLNDAPEDVIGSNYADKLIGTDRTTINGSATQYERLSGYGGSDTLSGEGGDDRLSGYTGNDTIYGGSQTGYDSCDGGSGTDHAYDCEHTLAIP